MNFHKIKQWLQGERRGMGSQLKRPKYETVSFPFPSIVIQLLVRLADVSFYQEVIDFVKMKAAGIAGVIVRAGQRSWLDIKFLINWLAAKLAGLPRGSYWFYDSRETPEKQAALWWGQVKNDIGELFHVADLEESYGGPYASKAHFKTFITEFQRLSGLPDNKIVIYTGFYWWNERVGNDLFFKRFRLWLAWYGAMEVVRIPAPWIEDDLILWQPAPVPEGPKYGVTSKEIDLDWYNGTPEQFAAEFGATEPETGGTMNYYQITNTAPSTNYRTIREGPAVVFGDVGKFYGGKMATGDFVFTYKTTDADLLATAGDKWIEIGPNQWIAQIHGGNVVSDLIVTALPVPASVDLSKLVVVASVALDIEGEKRVLTGTMTKV